MTKADGGKQRNNLPTMGESKAGIGGGGNGNSDSRGGSSSGQKRPVMAMASAVARVVARAVARVVVVDVDIGLVESPFQHTCL
jgi:hypothetical protein